MGLSFNRNSVQVQGTRVKADVEFEIAECALEREQAEADVYTADWDFLVANHHRSSRARERGTARDRAQGLWRAGPGRGFRGSLNARR
jgi:hypothetical protein